MIHRYVEVALPPPLARELTYRLPPELTEYAQVGSLVLVPVSRRMMTGVIVDESGPSGADGNVDPGSMRDVAQVLAGDTLLDPEIIGLCRWMAGYYFAPLGSTLLAALPPGLQVSSKRQVRLLVDGGAAPSCELEGQVVEQLRRGPLTVSTSPTPSRPRRCRRHRP